MRRPPEQTGGGADQIAERGIHWRRISRRHDAAERVAPVRIAAYAASPPHMRRIEIILHVVKPTIIGLPDMNYGVGDWQAGRVDHPTAHEQGLA